MIGAVRRIWDNFRGSGEAAVTVPPMDGALRPNRTLEEAVALLAAEAPDNLVFDGTRGYFSSGGVVLALDVSNGQASELYRFDRTVTALGAGVDGALAIGLDDGRVLLRGGAHDGKVIDSLSGRPLVCTTALLFASAGELTVAQGSASRPAREWKHDLMLCGATGWVARVDLASGKASLIGDRMSWPYGLAAAQNGAIAVCESWRHRIVLFDRDGGPARLVLEDLPGYPARLAPASGGGYWLSVFAPRNQLIEFVQREPEFLRRMMADIEPDYWAAPALKASSTFLEPLQGGAQKHLGMLKPWAPTRSYGLVVRLDRDFRPTGSFHSRADGTRHGIASCVEAGGRLLAASLGGGAIVALDLLIATPARMQAGE
ncbi:NHL repeat containing protein [Mesorhizobium sp. L-8-10]|uniref:strictosidine synthase n=1 Tax=Mesorhizobium sp. L-8-10 TaxID=2744523 RepID=UPI001928405D|nr:strictosidine synthase [Mesorhizobium sp. L-8-10]BCH33323.1 NHL repeat containing protein [Mesorhizobium sp. L-8-10]